MDILLLFLKWVVIFVIVALVIKAINAIRRRNHGK